LTAKPRSGGARKVLQFGFGLKRWATGVAFVGGWTHAVFGPQALFSQAPCRIVRFANPAS
jgi:hypothetical protein